MKRTKPLPRPTKPIARHAPPKRSTRPIAARKKDPAARRWAKHRCDPYLDWLTTEPCCVTGLRTGQWWPQRQNRKPAGPTGLTPVRIHVDPAHVRARGPGHDDLWNALPLAHHLHDEQHTRGAKTFWQKYGLDPVSIAREYTDRWLATDAGQMWLALDAEYEATR